MSVHIHNIRDFPQAMFNSKRNACFLLNKHGGLYFLLHNNSVLIILFNLRNFKRLFGTKKDIAESLHKTVTLGCKLWPLKQQLNECFTSTSFTIKWCDLFHKSYILFHMLYTFYLWNFLPSITSINCTSSYHKMSHGPINNACD